MQLQLRHISISHHNASTDIRQLFHLTEQEQEMLSGAIQAQFSDIRSLMLLNTCNRVEMYFESESTGAQQILQPLFQFKRLGGSEELRAYFTWADNSLDTVRHLLKVANGLDSRISGDAQIISQVKGAYLKAVDSHLQGKLLERSLQAAFRLHKRISNETMFRKGTVSFGLLSLQHIARDLGKDQLHEKRVLIVGAGEIAEEVAKYAAKFSFKEVSVTNRTRTRAEKLAAQYQLSVADWELIEKQDLQHFDAVISCVGNRANLIQAEVCLAIDKPMVLIDLAMPANIEKAEESREELFVYDLDTLAELKDTHQENREAARWEAEALLQAELTAYADWYHKLPVHYALNQFQRDIENEIKEFLSSKYKEEGLSAELMDDISKSLAKKLTRRPARKLMEPGLNGHTQEYLQVFKELF